MRPLQPKPPRKRREKRIAAIQGELSGLRLLLWQLDELLRDPTLTLALRRFAARVAAGGRGAAAATADAARRLVRAIGRLRLPRRLLLGLLALALPLALLALLLGSSDDRTEPSGGAAASQAQPAGGGFSLPGAGMPELLPSQTRPGAVEIALVADSADPAVRRELGTLGTWLAEHHAAGTRVSLIDARTGRATAALRPEQLGAARPAGTPSSPDAAVRSALARADGGRRLLVTVGTRTTAPAGADTLRVTTRSGAAPSPPVRSGRRSSVTIDERRPDALAGSVARSVMAISGQRERR